MTVVTLNSDWPPSVRLNKHLRAAFVRKVLEDVMPEEGKPKDEDFISEWNSQMYDIVFGPYLDTLEKMPSWGKQVKKDFRVNMLAHETNKSDWKGHNGTLTFTTPDGTDKVQTIQTSGYSYYSSDSGKTPQPPAGHECIDAYKRLLQQKKDWDVKRFNLERTLEKAVEGCNTSHQLFKVWPKAVQYADVFPAPEKKEAVRGGNPDVTGSELDIGVSIAKATVSQY